MQIIFFKSSQQLLNTIFSFKYGVPSMMLLSVVQFEFESWICCRLIIAWPTFKFKILGNIEMYMDTEDTFKAFPNPQPRTKVNLIFWRPSSPLLIGEIEI